MATLHRETEDEAEHLGAIPYLKLCFELEPSRFRSENHGLLHNDVCTTIDFKTNRNIIHLLVTYCSIFPIHMPDVENPVVRKTVYISVMELII